MILYGVTLNLPCVAMNNSSEDLVCFFKIYNKIPENQ